MRVEASVQVDEAVAEAALAVVLLLLVTCDAVVGVASAMGHLMVAVEVASEVATVVVAAVVTRAAGMVAVSPMAAVATAVGTATQAVRLAHPPGGKRSTTTHDLPVKHNFFLLNCFHGLDVGVTGVHPLCDHDDTKRLFSASNRDSMIHPTIDSVGFSDRLPDTPLMSRLPHTKTEESRFVQQETNTADCVCKTRQH